MNRVLTILILTLYAVTAYTQGSVLQSGAWYKLGIDKHGVYRINADQLNKMGFNVGKIDPRNIRIFGQEGGMLPQSNSIARPGGLVELAIRVTGEDDGVFNKDDQILFYAEGPNRMEFLPAKNAFLYEENLYTNKNYYFITVSEDKGKRIISDEVGIGGTPVDTFQDFVYYEKDEYNELKSGREWFGERFELNTEYAFNFEIEGIIQNTPLIFVSDVMAQSVLPSSFEIYFNNQLIGEQSVGVIGTSQYGTKGRHKRDTLNLVSTAVNAHQQTRQQITYRFKKGASGKSTGFLDFFSLHFTRALKLYGDQTIFRNAATANTNSNYLVDRMTSSNEIWNISDPYAPRQQKFTVVNGKASFSNESLSVSEFIAVSKFFTPELTGKVENQNLSGSGPFNYVIICHPQFKVQADRLAAFRRQQNNWTAGVFTTDQVYNEFSSGRQDITAIRDFIKLVYDKNPGVLKALLLFGRGSYDYKDRIPNNTNFVPTYESRNSLDPLATYSSDDFFGFLEDDEGEWKEGDFPQNHTLDIGVGRFPVRTTQEAQAVVDKYIRYDTDKTRMGKWRKDITFVADDGSNSDGFSSVHQAQADLLAENIEARQPMFNTRKIFLGTYSKNVSPNGETIPKVNQELREEFDQSVIINYTGHGSERVWADERILNTEDVQSLENRILPFLVTATCEFGRNDNPSEISTAELSILKAKGGSIGLVTTARPVNSSTNFSLNAAFYEALFEKDEGSTLTIGEVFRRTKNNSTSGVSNRNFSLLGDPGMIPALPQQQIVIDEIKTFSGSDTLKALSKVIVQGRVTTSDEVLIPTFNGTVEATLFDKKTRFETIGRNNPAFAYDQWFNPLFRGTASVTAGTFEFEFILPKNIAYEINPGKLSLYASNHEKTMDASGASLSFKIGGSEDNAPVDITPPVIEAFMGDTTFIQGGIVSPNTNLVVRLTDDSGLNISNYGIGNTMMAVLDDDQETFLLNEHFTTATDTYKKGWINFPLYNLPPGPHTLTVKVWDTYNNPAEATVRFNVSESPGLRIETLGNFPNPFAGKTTVFFTHNRPGEDLEANFTLLDARGQQIRAFLVQVPVSTYQVNILEIEENMDFAKNLPPGVYFGRLNVRSLSDGSSCERVTKLIVAN